MDTFAHFWRSEELHNEIAIVYTRNEPEKLERAGENRSFSERKALENWNRFLAHVLARSAVCCRMDFPSSIIFSLGFGFHDSSCFWRQPCRSWTVQAGNRISISVNKSNIFWGSAREGESVEQAETVKMWMLCAAVSGIIIWYKLIMSALVARIVVYAGEGWWMVLREKKMRII